MPLPMDNPVVASIVGMLAKPILDAIKSQPVAMLVLITNLSFCGVVVFVFHEQESYRHDERMLTVQSLLRCEATRQAQPQVPPHTLGVLPFASDAATPIPNVSRETHTNKE